MVPPTRTILVGLSRNKVEERERGGMGWRGGGRVAIADGGLGDVLHARGRLGQGDETGLGLEVVAIGAHGGTGADHIDRVLVDQQAAGTAGNALSKMREGGKKREGERERERDLRRSWFEKERGESEFRGKKRQEIDDNESSGEVEFEEIKRGKRSERTMRRGGRMFTNSSVLLCFLACYPRHFHDEWEEFNEEFNERRRTRPRVDMCSTLRTVSISS